MFADVAPSPLVPTGTWNGQNTPIVFFFFFLPSMFLPGSYTCHAACERHGYKWVPTDQGPGGPYQVDPTCQKSHQPASGLGDLIHNPGDLGRP
jgi:hypothetical protein